MKIFFLMVMFTALGCAAWMRSGDTVIDTTTHLQWHDDRQAEQRDTVWKDAKKYCTGLELGGFYDWRLPTRSEFQEMVKAHLSGAVTLNHTALDAYWTSEINRENPINAWAVYWGNGHTFDTDRCDEAYVRCVRDR